MLWNNKRIGMKLPLRQELIFLFLILGLGFIPTETEGVACYQCTSVGEYGKWKGSEPCGVPEAFNSPSISCPFQDHCYKRIGKGLLNGKLVSFVERGCLSEILPIGNKYKEGADKLLGCLEGKGRWTYARDVYVGCFNGTLNKTERFRSLDVIPYGMEGSDRIYVCKGAFCNRETATQVNGESLFSIYLKGCLIFIGFILVSSLILFIFKSKIKEMAI